MKNKKLKVAFTRKILSVLLYIFHLKFILNLDIQKLQMYGL